jgi:hypothetical protein
MFNPNRTQYLQPANIKRISAKCLHDLPGQKKLTMDPISLEIVLKSVEWLATALANCEEKVVLPDGMKCRRRQENILVLNLLRSIDRLSREDLPHFGVDSGADSGHGSGNGRERGRARSIWAQGSVPRNGGR